MQDNRKQAECKNLCINSNPSPEIRPVKPESHRITFVEKNDPVVSFGVIHTDKHK
jgi:hypothetical protein